MYCVTCPFLCAENVDRSDFEVHEFVPQPPTCTGGREGGRAVLNVGLISQLIGRFTPPPLMPFHFGSCAVICLRRYTVFIFVENGLLLLFSHLLCLIMRSIINFNNNHPLTLSLLRCP